MPPGYAALAFSGSFISKIGGSVGFGGDLTMEHGALCLSLELSRLYLVFNFII